MFRWPRSIRRLLKRNPELVPRARGLVETSGGAGFRDCLRIVLADGADLRCRIAAVQLMELLRYRKASRALAGVLKGPATPVELAWSAALALVQLGCKSQTPALIEVLRESRDLERRKAASYVLGMLGDRRAAFELSRIVADTNVDQELRSNAAEALGPCGRGSLVAKRAIAAATRDADPSIRLFATNAIGTWRDADFIPILRRLAKDDDGVAGPFGKVADEAVWVLSCLEAQ